MSGLPPTFVKGFHDEEAVRKMKYTQLGKTDLFVSKLSLGGGTFSQFYGDVDEAESIETVRQAIRSGINYIDTAPYYGQGRSEQILGKALQGVPREAYYIATKVARYELPPNRKQFDFSAERTLKSVDISLNFLGLDYVDVIQIHDVEFAANLDEVINETLPALEQVVKQGKARYIGVTGYPLDILKEAISRAPGRFQTVLAYARNTLLDDSLTDYIPFFEENNLGVICAASHAMGLLTNNGPQSWHPAHDETKEQGRKAAKLCKHHNVELGKLAMYHASQLKGAHSFLAGMKSKEQLKDNLEAVYGELNEVERSTLSVIENDICAKKSHWEGVETDRYFQRKVVAKISEN